MEKLLPEIDLLPIRADELRMKAQPGTDVLGLGGDSLVLRPGPRRGGDRERVDGKPLALGDEALEIRVEVKVAMEVYKTGQVLASDDMVSIPFRNAATSSIPLVYTASNPSILSMSSKRGPVLKMKDRVRVGS